MFLSTPPCRRRPVAFGGEGAQQHVSIHASVQEATRHATITSAPICFYPRLRAGGDGIGSGIGGISSGFYPRLRAGGDAECPCRLWRSNSFYPRLRAGGDRWRPVPFQAVGSFYPRLRAGGDIVESIHIAIAAVSIHASVQEATEQLKAAVAERLVSIHASVQEATLLADATPLGAPGFYPRLRAGGDRSRLLGSLITRCFYPRLRAGGD